MTELVLENVDELVEAIAEIDYDAEGGTGIEIVNYEERTATFLIKTRQNRYIFLRLAANRSI